MGTCPPISTREPGCHRGAFGAGEGKPPVLSFSVPSNIP
jgi:hypothetical protein